MKKILLIALLLLVNRAAYASACTSAATGNWSAPGTWSSCGGGVPGTGDTVSIGAHTITVDVNSSVGTSPNDTTTNVISFANAASVLTLATGVTLTVKGNVTWVNGASLTLGAGSTLTFDNSASGGSPVYKIGGAGINNLTINGTAGNPGTIQAISGQTYSLNGTNFTSINATYGNFTRMAVSSIRSFSAMTFSNCTFDTCGLLTLADNTASGFSLSITDSTWTNTTGSSGCLTISFDGSISSATRTILRNVFDKTVTYSGQSFTIMHNYFGSSITCVSTKTWAVFRLNFLVQDGSVNSGNGARLTATTERNYWVVENTTGNPHFIEPEAKSGVDVEHRQNVFESHTPDLLESGDIFIVQPADVTAGRKITLHNNLVIPNSSAVVMSGSLLTLYNADTNARVEVYRSTVNLDKSEALGISLGILDVAEAGTGFAGQVPVFKSNVGWSVGSGEGLLAVRLSGNVKDIITAAGADYNWAYNLATGDNQRSYDDYAAANTLWTAGDAVAASVDTHQGTGNPSFYDSTRNVAAWAAARGYGAGTYAAGLTALQTSMSARIPDLINYVFEGFRPGNATMRNAAHDGGVVGAANFYKSTRTLTTLNQHRAGLSKFGL